MTNKTKYKASIDPRRVCAAIRQWKRAGVRMSYMDQDALRYAHELGLIRDEPWPASHGVITPEGYDYLIENENGGDDE